VVRLGFGWCGVQGVDQKGCELLAVLSLKSLTLWQKK
jgi:hypothetical protein